MRPRAALLAHRQQTHSQDTLPDIGKKLASQANRDGGADRFPELAVQKSMEVDLALLNHDDRLRTDLELSIVKTATQDAAQPFYRRRAVPGIGKIFARVLLDASHDSQRFPRVQEFVSACRVVKCAKDSAGNRYGTSGTTMGKADRTWAFSEAAVLFLRHNPAGPKSRARREKNHGTGNAVTGLAHQLARAVYAMVPRDTAFALDHFFQA